LKKHFLVLILIAAAALRILWLKDYPPGFTPDEASFGYDAYSILKTGKDQWGHPFPLVFESFGDFKSPLYTYLAIPTVFIFGLNEFSVRLPNAILGTAAVYLVFLLTRKIKEISGMKNDNGMLKPEIVAAFLLAFSPWHIMMSRGAFEANLTTFLLPLAIYLFLKGLEKPKFLAWSALVFGLNIFSYHAAKLVTPLVLATLLVVFQDSLKKLKNKQVLVPAVILTFFVVVFAITVAQGSSTRAADVNIFKGTVGSSSMERLHAVDEGLPDEMSRIFHNKVVVGIRRFSSNYIQYMSTLFLFAQGPAEGTYGMMPGRGVFYWPEVILFIGSFIFIVKRKPGKIFLPLFVWLFTAPIPAALAVGPGYSANRSVILLPVVQIFLAFGLNEVLLLLNTNFIARYKKLIMTSFGLVWAVLFVFFLEDYFLQSPYKIDKAMNYGNIEVARWVVENDDGFKEFVITKKLSEPHIYFAFAGKIDPEVYQKYSSSWDYKGVNVGWVDQIPSYSLERYTFRNIDWNSDGLRSAILVGRAEDFPDGVVPIKTFYYPNGNISLLVVDPQSQTYADKN